MRNGAGTGVSNTIPLPNEGWHFGVTMESKCALQKGDSLLPTVQIIHSNLKPINEYFGCFFP